MSSCSEEIFTTTCLSLLFSKLLSFAIIFGALMFKIPQIIQIISAKSAQGLSEIALFIESFSLLITSSYSYRSNFPISTYGEIPIVFIQNIIILLLIYYFKNKYIDYNIIYIIFLILFQLLSLNNLFISFKLIEIIYSFQIFTIIGSVLPQIYKIYIEQNTGQLSFSTNTFAFIGCCVRLFTTIKELNDIMATILIFISTLMRGILFLQFFIYTK